jgi:hypothetical protein
MTPPELFRRERSVTGLDVSDTETTDSLLAVYATLLEIARRPTNETVAASLACRGSSSAPKSGHDDHALTVGPT